MIVMLAALAAAQSPVVVSSLATQQLVQDCRGNDTDPAANFCTGFIIGVFDTLSASHQICPPPNGASTIEAVAAARKYLRTRRKTWSSAPSFVVRDALRGAFPCRSGSPGPN